MGKHKHDKHEDDESREDEIRDKHLDPEVFEKQAGEEFAELLSEDAIE